MNSSAKYWIAFSSIEQLDSKFIVDLYEHYGDIEKAWNCSDIKTIEGMSIKKAENFLRLRDKINPDEKLNYVLEQDISFINYDDKNYPKLLKEISNPPATLYFKGNLNQCNLNRTLAVVGSRRATRGIKDVLPKIISELGGTDLCIVSGLASGVDTIAHKSAIENNLKTIGVIASGHNYVYPSSNRELYKKIEDGYGVIMSEYYPTFAPIQFRFPQRNRIVTGLSYGTLVAEAALKSGALISAGLCLEQGRELMCVPGLITNPNTAGIYKLLKNGATLVTCGEDILNALGWELRQRKQLKLKLEQYSEEEKSIIDVIKYEPETFDTLLQKTKMNSDTLLVLLTGLEIKGKISQIEGQKYKLNN